MFMCIELGCVLVYTFIDTYIYIYKSYTMRRALSTWEQSRPITFMHVYIYIPRIAKRWEPSEWIVQQIEWRKYVTNKHNNNSMCVTMMRERANRMNNVEHATAMWLLCLWLLCVVSCLYRLWIESAEQSARKRHRADTKN